MEVTDTKHIVALCGSQRGGSHTHPVLDYYRHDESGEEQLTDESPLERGEGREPEFVDDAGVASGTATTIACAVPTGD